MTEFQLTVQYSTALSLLCYCSFVSFKTSLLNFELEDNYVSFFANIINSAGLSYKKNKCVKERGSILFSLWI